MARIDFSMLENKENFLNEYGMNIKSHLLSMTNKRKLFYVPGMISLTGYLLLLPYVYKKTLSKPVAVISIVVPKFSVGKNEPGYVFSESWILNDIRNKKKTRFWLDNDHESNKKKIELIRFEAKKLEYTLDSSSVILIEFTDDLVYEELFRIYDNCIADKIKRFASWDSYFVIFGGYRLSPKKSNDAELILINL
jgi:hypothetical protein